MCNKFPICSLKGVNFPRENLLPIYCQFITNLLKICWKFGDQGLIEKLSQQVIALQKGCMYIRCLWDKIETNTEL